ncbi:regulatory protein GemA [Roseovarius dicentrarchi]|uniref:regulatory protein GemA n=1 Tax=Roseovarius dicentrarchi TaxID=2250573 RepID=UPI000DEADC93|nr:regulatory protein GemA [Roseovarius dicentrarchi]
MTLSRKQLAILHVAKSKLGLSDNHYRGALVHLTGATSAKELDQSGFEIVMGYFEWMGFAPMKARGQDYGTRKGMASFAQCELIRALWAEYTRHVAGEDELNKWLLRSFQVSSLRFLTATRAAHAITALKAMKARAA